MLKLGRRARGHFVTLIEICVHLIRVKPGHICAFPNNHIFVFLIILIINRLKYLNLEHNEISSIPHLRLLGARVREDNTSRQENAKTVESSLPGVLEENEKEMQKEEESTHDQDKENVDELTLDDEVDDMLSRNLVDHERGEERNRPEIKPSSSNLTEDPSLLGNLLSTKNIKPIEMAYMYTDFALCQYCACNVLEKAVTYIHT